VVKEKNSWRVCDRVTEFLETDPVLTRQVVCMVGLRFSTINLIKSLFYSLTQPFENLGRKPKTPPLLDRTYYYLSTKTKTRTKTRRIMVSLGEASIVETKKQTRGETICELEYDWRSGTVGNYQKNVAIIPRTSIIQQLDYIITY
jgi:hypothetical protein